MNRILKNSGVNFERRVCRNLCSGFHKVVDIIIKVTYNDNSYCIDPDRYRGGHP